MSAEDRAAREEKVIEQVREWLPELMQGAIVITALDPTKFDGAFFSVTRPQAQTFVCRRGGGS